MTSTKPVNRFPDFARWMQEDGYAVQTCKEYPYFLDRYRTAFNRPIDRNCLASEQDVKRIADDVRRAISGGGRGAGEFNIHDLQRNLLPALRLYVKFATGDDQSSVAIDVEADELPPRVAVVISRVVRDTKMVRRIKAAHKHYCQLCGDRLELSPGKFYSEGHHLRPLGKKHGGFDKKGNILCVCANCHVKLDFAAIKIDLAKLGKAPGHSVRPDFIDYHNGLCP